MMSHRIHRGFTITELLATLGLLVIFFDAAGRVFRASVDVSRTGQEFTDQSSRTDSAMLQLRRDVWNAKQVRADDSRRIELTSADGNQITWKFGDDGITRSGSSVSSQHWADACENYTASVSGAYLDIRDGTEVVRLTGPMLLRQQ
jgi:hypothetical protein